MKKNKQLGQGLGALLTPSKQQIEDFSQSSILLSKIKPNPNQPRKNFEDKSLKQLAQSIDEKGLISPITVKKIDNKYIIVAGERRYRAHKLLNKKRILAYVIDADSNKDVPSLTPIIGCVGRGRYRRSPIKRRKTTRVTST